jgi:hypothetical protein
VVAVGGVVFVSEALEPLVVAVEVEVDAEGVEDILLALAWLLTCFLEVRRR